MNKEQKKQLIESEDHTLEILYCELSESLSALDYLRTTQGFGLKRTMIIFKALLRFVKFLDKRLPKRITDPESRENRALEDL